MILSHRDFNFEQDLPLFDSLLRKRGLPKADTLYLPPTGVVAMADGKPIAVGFMVICDNRMAINTDFISDPDAPKEVRNDVVQFMREVLYEKAKDAKCMVTCIFTSIEPLRKKLEGLGYSEMDKNLTHMGRFLWPLQG